MSALCGRRTTYTYSAADEALQQNGESLQFAPDKFRESRKAWHSGQRHFVLLGSLYFDMFTFFDLY